LPVRSAGLIRPWTIAITRKFEEWRRTKHLLTVIEVEEE
jgi:hypothetical protein